MTMRMRFRQRFFSWLDSYDIFDDAGAVLYTVKSRMDWGHNMSVFDQSGRVCGCLREKIWTLRPEFHIECSGPANGRIRKTWNLIHPTYHIEPCGWQAEGNFVGWDYEIRDREGGIIAQISKELLHLTDTYVIDVEDPQNALGALLFVMAIDAEKCSA